MKKLITIFTILACITSFVAAEAYVQEADSQDVRVELGLTAFGNTNCMVSAAGLDEQIKISTFNNRVGFIAGVRESVDFFGDSNKSIVPNWTPFFGIDLWNVDLLVGLNFSEIGQEEPNILSMVQLAYNFDIIKPNMNPVSNSLSIKLGVNWYVNQFIGWTATNSDSSKSSEEQLSDAIGSAFLYLFSIIIPRVEVGVTYRLGHSFILN